MRNCTLATYINEGTPPEVVVSEPDSDKAKGRSFGATLLAWVEADGLWEGGKADTEVRRPIYAAFACSEGALAPFKANCRLGHRIDIPDGEVGNKYSKAKGDRWEFLRSAGYRLDDQRWPDIGDAGFQVTMPALMRYDGAGMIDNEGAAFLVITPKAWAEAQRMDDAAVVQYVRSIGYLDAAQAAALPTVLPSPAAMASLFATFFMRRTGLPLPLDPRLFMQILLSAVDHHYAGLDVELTTSSFSRPKWGCTAEVRMRTHGLARVGCLPAVAFNAKHSQIEPWLADEVSLFLAKTGKPGKAKRAA